MISYSFTGLFDAPGCHLCRPSSMLGVSHEMVCGHHMISLDSPCRKATEISGSVFLVVHPYRVNTTKHYAVYITVVCVGLPSPCLLCSLRGEDCWHMGTSQRLVDTSRTCRIDQRIILYIVTKCLTCDSEFTLLEQNRM